MSVGSLKTNNEVEQTNESSDFEVEQTNERSNSFYLFAGIIASLIPVVSWFVFGFSLVAALTYEGEEKEKWKWVLIGWLLSVGITLFLCLCLVIFVLWVI